MFHERIRNKENGIITVYWRENGQPKSKAVSSDRAAVDEFKTNLAIRLQRGKAGLTIRKYPFLTFCDEYINEYAYAEKQANSILRDKATIKTFLTLFPHLDYVDNYTSTVVNIYKGKRKQMGRKESCINRELGTLKSMLSFAKRKRYKDEDDSGEVSFYEVGKEVRARLVTDQELSFYLGVTEHPIRTAFYLAAFSGLRAGEACHLEWQNVDFGKNLIHICIKSDWKPKNRTSARDIPIHPELKKVLLRAKAKGKGAYVCAYEDGHRLDEGVLASMVRKINRRYGKTDFCFHMLRHLFVSKMAAGGADVLAISKIIGHSNTSITESTYTHLKTTYYHQNIGKLNYKIKPM